MKTIKDILILFLCIFCAFELNAQEPIAPPQQFSCALIGEELNGWHFSGGSFRACNGGSTPETSCNTCLGTGVLAECCRGITCLDNNIVGSQGQSSTVFRNVEGMSLLPDPHYGKDRLFQYIQNQNALDPNHPCISQVKPGSNASVRLGSYQPSSDLRAEPSNLAQVYFDFIVDPSKPFYEYSYALIIGDNPSLTYVDNAGETVNVIPHPHGGKSFFEVRVYDISNINQQNLPLIYDKHVSNQAEEIICGSNLYTPHSEKAGFKNISTYPNESCGEVDQFSDIFVKNWSSNIIDLRAKKNRKIRVVFTVTGCAYGGHYAYAYLDASCLNRVIKPETVCVGDSVQLEFTGVGVDTNEHFTWNVGNQAVSHDKSPKYVFASSGERDVSLTVVNDHPNPSCRTTNFTEIINVINCIVCDTCDIKFSLKPNQKYVLGAWAQEGVAQPFNSFAFNAPQIKLIFKDKQDNILSSFIFGTSGKVVDGWQRIEEEFIVPAGAQNLDIEFINTNSSIPVYFDDFRIHPFNSSMVTYVYNQETMQLEAQLDENNFYTRYIYDEEGNLVKTTVETIDGTRTAAETRSNIQRK